MPHVEDADEKPLDVSMAESANIRNRQGLEGEVSTSPQIPAQKPVPQFQHSNSLFHRKKSRKKR
jgi:hypothetical protein